MKLELIPIQFNMLWWLFMILGKNHRDDFSSSTEQTHFSVYILHFDPTLYSSCPLTWIYNTALYLSL